MESAPASVEQTLDRAGQEYRAEAHKSEASTRKAVEQLEQKTTPVDELGSLTNEQLAGLIVGLAAVLVPAFVNKALVYSEDEQEQIARAAVPVLNKYFPDGGLPCEVVLLGTVGLITVPKLLSARAAAKAGGGTTAAAGGAASTPSEQAAA